MGKVIFAITICFAILLLSVSIVSFTPIDAKKSSGNSSTETSSNRVCGDRLCDKPESISEKINNYLSEEKQSKQTSQLPRSVSQQQLDLDLIQSEEVQNNDFWYKEIQKAIDVLYDYDYGDQADRVLQLLDDTGTIEVGNLTDARGKTVSSDLIAPIIGKDIILDKSLFDLNGANRDSPEGFLKLVDLAGTLLHESDHYDNDIIICANCDTAAVNEERSWKLDLKLRNGIVDDLREKTSTVLSSEKSNQEKIKAIDDFREHLKLFRMTYAAFEQEGKTLGFDISYIEEILLNLAREDQKLFKIKAHIQDGNIDEAEALLNELYPKTESKDNQSIVTSNAKKLGEVTFVVNDPRNIPDGNPGDGKCDTGGTNEKYFPLTGKCTFLAAINESNAFEGTATIRFAVSEVYVDGDDRLEPCYHCEHPLIEENFEARHNEFHSPLNDEEVTIDQGLEFCLADAKSRYGPEGAEDAIRICNDTHAESIRILNRAKAFQPFDPEGDGKWETDFVTNWHYNRVGSKIYEQAIKDDPEIAGYLSGCHTDQWCHYKWHEDQYYGHPPLGGKYAHNQNGHYSWFEDHESLGNNTWSYNLAPDNATDSPIIETGNNTGLITFHICDELDINGKNLKLDKIWFKLDFDCVEKKDWYRSVVTITSTDGCELTNSFVTGGITVKIIHDPGDDVDLYDEIPHKSCLIKNNWFGITPDKNPSGYAKLLLEGNNFSVQDNVFSSNAYNFCGKDGTGICEAPVPSINYDETNFALHVSGDGNIIENNLVGTDENGEKRYANRAGIQVWGDRNSLKGNTVSGSVFDIDESKLSIYDNLGVGIHIFGDFNDLIHNRVGTDILGTTPMGNQNTGVIISGNNNSIQENTISDNGGFTNRENLLFDTSYILSFPHDYEKKMRDQLSRELPGSGLLIEGLSNEVWGNKIGTDVHGFNNLSNQGAGIALLSSGGGNYDTNYPDEYAMDQFVVRTDIPLNEPNCIGTTTKPHPLNPDIFVCEIDNIREEKQNIISNNGFHGVVSFGYENAIVNNLIGTSSMYDKHRGNGNSGILISSNYNHIADNVIVNNAENGIEIRYGDFNTIEDNKIGVIDDEAYPNFGHGIYIKGAHNLIGHDFRERTYDEEKTIVRTPPQSIKPYDHGNTISGNGGDGIHIIGENSTGNIITGNVIGLDEQGNQSIGNNNGIYIDDGWGTRIGHSDLFEYNFISGNHKNGIFMSNVAYSYIDNNLIGLGINPNADSTQLISRPNSGDGIQISQGSEKNNIGWYWGNIIGGNKGNGIKINENVKEILILDNKIGLYDQKDLPTEFHKNEENGIFVEGNHVVIEKKNKIASHSQAILVKGKDNHIEENEIFKNKDGVVLEGTNNEIIKNKIFENTNVGIKIPGNSNIVQENILYHNMDGIAISGDSNQITKRNIIGSFDLNKGPNFRDGITISGNKNLIKENPITANERNGISMDGNRNVIDTNGICWNKGAGILIEDGDNNEIVSNTIGCAGITEQGLKQGNGRHGIELYRGAEDNFMFTNTIHFNGLDGVHVLDPITIKNTISQNSISANILKGIENLKGGNIELDPPTVQQMDPPKPGPGVKIKLEGSTCPSCTVELFSEPPPGEEGLLYEVTVPADKYGNWEISNIFKGPHITCTATDLVGNTSEFGCHDIDIPVLPFDMIKTDKDLNAGDFTPNDIIEYEIIMLNNSDHPIRDVSNTNEFEDKIPENVEYVKDSITVDGQFNDDSISDGTGFDITTNNVIWNGIILAKSQLNISFQVKINSNTAETISNQAFFYQGQISISSDDPNTAIIDDPTITIVTKSDEKQTEIIEESVDKIQPESDSTPKKIIVDDLEIPDPFQRDTQGNAVFDTSGKPLLLDENKHAQYDDKQMKWKVIVTKPNSDEKISVYVEPKSANKVAEELFSEKYKVISKKEIAPEMTKAENIFEDIFLKKWSDNKKYDSVPTEKLTKFSEEILSKLLEIFKRFSLN